MLVKVRLSDGSQVDAHLSGADATVLALKTTIENLVSPPAPPATQKIVWRGRILKDEDTIGASGAWVCVRRPGQFARAGRPELRRTRGRG